MRSLRRILASMVLLGSLSLAAGEVGAVVITGPVNLSAFTTGANYGPPAPAHFTEPGPITVNAGTSTPFFTGPNYGAVDSLLLVISGTIPAGDVITLTYDNLAPVVFHTSDFVSTAAAGFPAMIGGIANGDVNGIVFPSATHAGADLTMLPTGLATDAFLANVTISQTVATSLRVDVFGDLNGKIINNAANSGALGVVGVPAPVIGQGLPVLAVCGLLFFGAKLLQRSKKRGPLGTVVAKVATPIPS